MAGVDDYAVHRCKRRHGQVKMMNDDITLRPAQPDDADRAAVLLYSAYLHRQVSYPLHEEGENRFIERLQYFFRRVQRYASELEERYLSQPVQPQIMLTTQLPEWSQCCQNLLCPRFTVLLLALPSVASRF